MSDAKECVEWLMHLAKDYAPLADDLGAMKFNKTLTSGAKVTFTFREARVTVRRKERAK